MSGRVCLTAIAGLIRVSIIRDGKINEGHVFGGMGLDDLIRFNLIIKGWGAYDR